MSNYLKKIMVMSLFLLSVLESGCGGSGSSSSSAGGISGYAYLLSQDPVYNIGIWKYTVNQTTGALTFTGESAPIPSGFTNLVNWNPWSVAVNGNFLYVPNPAATNAGILIYEINPFSGSLSYIGSAPIPLGLTSSTFVPYQIVFHANFAYVSTRNSGIIQYKVDRTYGGLSSPQPVIGSTDRDLISGMAISNPTNTLYTDFTNVYQYNIMANGTGVLTYANQFYSLSVPNLSVLAAIGVNQYFAYIVPYFNNNPQTSQIYLYGINPANGNLSNLNTIISPPAGILMWHTHYLEFYNNFCYIPDSLNNAMWIYQVNPSTGLMTYANISAPLPTGIVANQWSPYDIAFYPPQAN